VIAIRVPSGEDPRLDPFRAVADPVRIRREGRFVAEGRHLVRELLLHGGYEVEGLLLSHAAHEALREDLEGRAGDAFVVEGRAELERVTGYRFHQGCLALARLPARRGLDDLPRLAAPGARLVVGLEGVTDPDNVGAIFRTARAFAADAVLLSPGCAHPLYRKALRTSMAAALHLPFAWPDPWEDGLARLSHAGYSVLALTPASDATPLDAALADLAPAARTLLLLGSEERGLAATTLAAADVRVRIPTEAAVDSLNVAAAAAVALHALHAGRAAGSGDGA